MTTIFKIGIHNRLQFEERDWSSVNFNGIFGACHRLQVRDGFIEDNRDALVDS